MKRLSIIWTCLLVVLTSTASAQSHGQEEICGIKGAETKQYFLAYFREYANLVVTYSPSQWDLKDSVYFDVDCMSYEAFFAQLTDHKMAVRFFPDKVIVYLDNEQRNNQPFDLSGYVKDAVTGEKLLSATIYLPDQKRGTVTNAFGYFHIPAIRPGDPLLVSFVGYQPMLIIPERNSAILDVFLSPNIQLEAVEVLSERQQQFEQLTSPDQVLIPSAPYNLSPFLGGEPDVLKMIQQETGVLSNEVTTGPIVRGGGPDQNLVLLDDVPMYDYSHMLGFASIFNSDMINRVDFYKSSFPAQYGGRLSSVIDIRSKDGNPHQWQGNVTLGLFAQKLQIDGPIDRKGKLTIITSGRIATLKPLIRVLPIDEIKGFSPEFYDGHFKLNFIPDKKNQFNLLYFRSTDKLTDKNSDEETVANIPVNFEQTEQLNWTNEVLAGKWQRRWNRRIFSSTTFFTSSFLFETRNLQKYRFVLPDETIGETYDYFAHSDIRDIGIKSSWEAALSNDQQLKWGTEIINHTFRPSIRRDENGFSENTLDSLRKTTAVPMTEWSNYLEWGWRYKGVFRMVTGLRQTAYFMNQGNTLHLMPRWSAVLNINPSSSLSAGYSRTVQFMHLLPTPVVGYPTDLWIPSTPDNPPQKADLFFLNFSYLYRDKLFMKMGLYYKEMSSLLSFQNDIDATDNSWQEQLITGTGRAMGYEFSLENTKGNLRWGVNYSLSRSTRTFAEIKQGDPFPFRFDRLHDLKIRCNYHLSDNAQLGINWTLASGLPFTVGVISFQPQSPPGLAFPPTVFTGERNNERMPWLHRLDIILNVKRKNSNSIHNWSMGVYNLYNRFNPFAVKVIAEESSQQIVLRETSLYPILPFFTYKLTF